MPWQARATLLSLRILALLPLSWLRGFGSLVGFIISILPTRETRVTQQNISLCLPELDQLQAAALARTSLQHLLMSVFELPKIWNLPYPKLARLIVGVTGEETYKNALALGKGVIIAVPHLGAWELLNLYLASHSELAVLYRAPRKPWVESLLNAARGRTRALPVRAEPAAVRGLLKRLQSGGVLGILPDQQPKQGEGEFAPMFGIDALTMTLLPKLAVRTGATVLFACAVRVPNGFRIELRTALPEVIDVATLNLNVENLVQPWLAQYQWSYKRYSMRPQGQPRIYR